MRTVELLLLVAGCAYLCGAQEEDDSECALLQTQTVAAPHKKIAKEATIARQSRGHRDLSFVHVPMNFGNSIAEQAAVGADSTLSYDDITGAGEKGWDYIDSISQEDATIWAAMHPDLNVKSNWNGIELMSDNAKGCPMYYTPQQYWPKELADKYIGNNIVFGVMRDPFDRIMAMLRGMGGPVSGGFDFVPDNKTCGAQFSATIKGIYSSPDLAGMACQLQLQLPFFEGANAITKPLALEEFPGNAQTFLDAHGYDNVKLDAFDLKHVTSCDATWAGDLDAEAKQIIRKYYASDFAFVCNTVGNCDLGGDESQCARHIPGMCPSNLFEWDDTKKVYIPL